MHLRNRLIVLISLCILEKISLTLKRDKIMIVEIILNFKIKTIIKDVIPQFRVELGKHTCEKTPSEIPKNKKYENKANKTAHKISIFRNSTTVKMI